MSRVVLEAPKWRVQIDPGIKQCSDLNSSPDVEDHELNYASAVKLVVRAHLSDYVHTKDSSLKRQWLDESLNSDIENYSLEITTTKSASWRLDWIKITWYTGNKTW